MPSSSSCGLAFMCLAGLLFLLAQGRQPSTSRRFHDPVSPSCCTKVSKARIKETVTACFVQMPETLKKCKIHAYMFITDTKKTYCVNPEAPWLEKKLKELELKGILCQQLF